MPLSTLQDVAAIAKEAGMATHMDGARLFNAVAATGISAAAYAESFDSVWIDLSKGLGCPIGAVLCGSADFIRKAWRPEAEVWRSNEAIWYRCGSGDICS